MSGKGDKTASTAGEAKATEEPKKAPPPTKPDDMTPEELEFITAIDEYKRVHGRKFPNWSEVLRILRSLGYAKGA